MHSLGSQVPPKQIPKLSGASEKHTVRTKGYQGGSLQELQGGLNAENAATQTPGEQLSHWQGQTP